MTRSRVAALLPNCHGTTYETEPSRRPQLLPPLAPHVHLSILCIPRQALHGPGGGGRRRSVGLQAVPTLQAPAAFHRAAIVQPLFQDWHSSCRRCSPHGSVCRVRRSTHPGRGREWPCQLSGGAGSGSASSAGGPRARPPLGPPNPAHQAFKVLNGLLDVIQSVSLVLKLLRELAARLWPIRQLLHRGLLGSHSAVGPKGGLCGSRPGRCTACMRVRRSIVG